MKMHKRVIALLLVWGAVVPTGCYSLSTVADPETVHDDLHVLAVNSDVYHLESWEILPGGDIRGIGVRKRSVRNLNQSSISSFEGIIRLGDITSYATEEFDPLKTTIAVGGAVVCACGIGGLFWVLSHSFWSIPSFNVGF